MQRAIGHFKDEILDELAREANVAQFASFGPDLAQRFTWIRGYQPGHRFASVEAAVAAQLEAADDRSVNIRSYEPRNPKSREFLYGLRSAKDAAHALRRLAGDGLTTIVNETIDIGDGGVSGVAFGGVIEFAPEDTPRCVERPGTAALPRAFGLDLLETVYGFRLDLPASHELRVEFSLHPLRRGFHQRHTIIWETEAAGEPPADARITWPHRFSRFLGDKAYGLLVAFHLGLPVPHTLSIPRKLPPFSFGSDSGLVERWIRTCPTEQVPGRFTTKRGWTDPFQLLQNEDPEGRLIASILSQQGIDAAYSGAVVGRESGDPLVEGIGGFGDEFMTGTRPAEELPDRVRRSVLELYRRAAEALGPVRFEWVDDGRRTWVVQLHHGASAGAGQVIFPGEAARFHRFEVGLGIEALRALIDGLAGSGDGVVLVGRVGLTSHLGDILRRARIPSRLEAPEDAEAPAAP